MDVAQKKKSMDVAMLSHSISNILQWMNSLKPLANKLSRIDIKQLEKDIKQINDKVQTHHSDSLLFPQPWLQKVKEVLIDLNDLMEDLRQKESTSVGLKVKDRFKATLQVKKATDELKRLLNEEATDELKRLLNEEDAKGAAAAAVDTDDRRKFAYDDFVAVGRENEKKEIIDQLLNLKSADTDAAVPVFIAIVGVTGIGKTKLAHLVCEDEQVKANFEFEQISMNGLMGETLDVESSHQIPHHEIPTCTMTTTTNGKPRLLIIDDLRIAINKHDDLEKLQKKLMEVAGGRTNTVILITTCSNHVANNIGATYVLKLQGLNQKESWSLFQQIYGPITSTKKAQSTIEPESKPKPEQSLEIMRDCGGVPLLIVIVAKVMTKHSGVGGEEWIREALEKVKLIYYDDLPTYQKLCFAYCSLFPEDYLIDAERLIQLWTGEGFLINPEQQFGHACFEDFVPLVFHQAEEESDHQKYCGVVRNNMNNYLYRMNRLMHKLARQEIAGDENITVDVMGERVRGGTLRVSFNFALDLSCEIPDSVFQTAKKLRTILLPYNINNPRLPHEVKMTTSTCDKIFDTFKYSLRVLDLHDLGIKTVPSSIEDVKYLRYLDLSHNNMEKLPSCITNLIHLQTLKLSRCHVLKELPKDMDDLSCLNHLDLDGCLDLTQMPSGISKLTSLQTLSLFVASKKQVTGGLRSLTDLNNLRGHLEIMHLEQIKFSPSKEAAKDDFLKNKQHLEFLTLRWDHDEEDEESNVEKDKKSLDCLQPHPNLQVLLVVGYNGHTLSNWLASLQCLVKFTLNDCPKCEFLPPMDELPHLKVLQLRRLDSLKFIAKNNQADTPIFFPSLKELTISDCLKLKGWWENDIWDNDRPSFSCISKLNIQYCPQLACMLLYPGLDDELVLVESNVRSMRDTMHYADSTESTETSSSQSQPFSKLKSMVIERIDQSPPESWLKNFISLEELHIRDCFILESLPQGFKFLSSLISLSIERCEQLVLDIDKSAGTEWDGLTEWEGLKNLQSLTLRSIPKLKSLPWGVENVKTLKDLRIYDCHGLTSLPESIGC
ncbi:putative P-loop containing nucleoside triphosphate hydrolase, leucine-rich repeat domain, L [Medicago truncatula]|uniref:Putative P-loop containing nucleoside triphosphate hydrolase, leucine-rich repeat domain, L n=1 Tax=Medicago truncatula TaxID=3880 RepID=A0A396HQH5_MEDTR|nr:putative P-loop containing nucleoside triphosphate hydrolase, leucine-rich repeat domain, L [Medicago truncatula]